MTTLHYHLLLLLWAVPIRVSTANHLLPSHPLMLCILFSTTSINLLSVPSSSLPIYSLPSLIKADIQARNADKLAGIYK